MRTFYYSKTRKSTSYGSLKVTLRIYKIVKKEPILLCEHTFNTGSTMGEKSEVLQALVKIGILPKKYENKYYYEIPHKAYEL